MFSKRRVTFILFFSSCRAKRETWYYHGCAVDQYSFYDAIADFLIESCDFFYKPGTVNIFFRHDLNFFLLKFI